MGAQRFDGLARERWGEILDELATWDRGGLLDALATDYYEREAETCDDCRKVEKKRQHFAKTVGQLETKQLLTATLKLIRRTATTEDHEAYWIDRRGLVRVFVENTNG